jgi:hypothetical protein
LTRRALAALALLPLALLPLFVNARASVEGQDLQARLPGWRGWDDLAIALGHQVSGDYPVAPYQIANRFRRDLPDFVAFRDELLLVVSRERVRPQQFWRTVDVSVFRADQLSLARRWDDPGRALMLVLGFELLGGVAPYLLSWLGVLFAVLVLSWLGLELLAAGRPVAAFASLALLVASAFLVDVLMLGYAGAAFPLLTLLLALALASYALVGSPAPRGLLLRATAAGVLFGWFALARSVSLLSLPGLLLALALAAFRATPKEAPPLRRAAPLLAASLLLLAPYFVLRAWNDARMDATRERLQIQRGAPQQHDVWITLWQGLGDFDRSKGHVFLDMAGELEARKHGSNERLSPLSEAIFRKLVLKDIREDPLWFAGILARRAWATLTLLKLLPREASDGRSFAAAAHEAEGVTDNYYAMTLRADQVRLGRLVVELPLPILWLFPLGLVAVAARGDAEARRGLLVVACLALAALPAPVLITTASAFEVQSAVVVHLAAAGFLAQAGWDALRRAAAARAGSRP